MRLIIGGIDVSDKVQDGGVTKGSVYRSVKERVTLGGKRYVSRVKKLLYTIAFDPMSEQDLKNLVRVIDQDYVQVVYKDPVEGFVYSTFIPDLDSVELILEDRDGVSYWSGLVLTLEEQ